MSEQCGWYGIDEIYIRYHDDEWGVPERDSRALFEKLILDGFQAGLSWITILKKRAAFREAFDGFDPDLIAAYGPAKVDSLVQDRGIVRHRGKIEAAIGNARAWQRIQENDSFADFLWRYLDGTPLQNNFERTSEIPAQTPLSTKISKDLKAAGFKFCGPTIVYAFMQAVGMVNDHLVGCPRHLEVQRTGNPGLPD